MSAPEHSYLYPHPLTLARNRAEAERERLADAVAYSSMCATWGQLGGLTTFYRYGPGYYRLLALRRWKKAGADALAEHVQTAKATKKTEAG